MPINYLDTDQQRIYNEKVIKLNNWSRNVSDMNGFMIPERYGMQNVKGKYDRFTGFIQHLVEEVLASDPEDDIGDHEIGRAAYTLSGGRNDLLVGWWKVAQKVGSGKSVENTLPKFHEIDEEKKQTVYDTFLPAYRAIRESFEKRSIFQYFFNHSQYVAERDSLRALEAVMTTLTGDSKTELLAKLDEYVAEIPSSNISVSSKILQERIQKQLTEKAEEAKLDLDAIELENVPQTEETEELTQENELAYTEEQPDIHVEANNGIRFAMTLNQEGFEDRIIEQMKNALPKDYKLSTNLDTMFFKGFAFGYIIERAANDFNANMDEAIEQQATPDIEQLDSVVMDGIKSVFAEAYNCTRLLSLPLKDRLLVAQRFSDIALNAATPVAFQQEAFGQCSNGFMLMGTDLNMIKDVVNEQLKENESFTDEEIEAAYNQARADFELEMNRTSIVIDDVKEVVDTNVVEKPAHQPKIDPLVHNK